MSAAACIRRSARSPSVGLSEVLKILLHTVEEGERGHGLQVEDDLVGRAVAHEAAGEGDPAMRRVPDSLVLLD